MLACFHCFRFSSRWVEHSQYFYDTQTAEAIVIQVRDVIFRSQHVAKTTVRLRNTKSNREQYVEDMPNSLAERILRFCAQGRNASDLLFEFKSYHEV